VFAGTKLNEYTHVCIKMRIKEKSETLRIDPIRIKILAKVKHKGIFNLKIVRFKRNKEFIDNF
jgi:hypothetical protein